MEIISTRRRRSESLTPQEHKSFIRLLKSFPTKIDAAQAIGLSRITIHNIASTGSGRPDSIELIRKNLASSAHEAA